MLRILYVLVLLLAASLRLPGVSFLISTFLKLCHPHSWSSPKIFLCILLSMITLQLGVCTGLPVTTGLPQYGTFYCNPAIGAPTCTGIDIRLAVFHAHLIFNRQMGINRAKKHGLKIFKNWNPSSGTKPFPPSAMQGEGYEFPIGRYMPPAGTPRGPARVIMQFGRPAIPVGVTSHDSHITDTNDHFRLDANRQWGSFLFEFFWSNVTFPVHVIAILLISNLIKIVESSPGAQVASDIKDSLS